jgi:hypothetical protein
MSREFVERRDESLYLIGSRVPLAHLVREFQRGESPEAIRAHYPALSLEQVYGAITFYLGSQKEVEADIAEREREEDAFTKAHPTPPEVKMKFERMQQIASRRGWPMVRFLADASLHDAIVTGCLRREPAIDFLSAHEARLEGVPDPNVLAFATKENRILVTSDLRTMPRHFGDFMTANGRCAGVFLVKQRAP